ncbi:MAG: CCA tRNA nucleotidyltransferase [Anaerolineales bacterium]
MTDWSLYAGRWVALRENGQVASVGETAAYARYAAHAKLPKEHLRLMWVAPQPPHVLIPEWPLARIRPILPAEGVWLAGGPVRDLLLRRPLHDWDFAVAGSGREIAREVADTLHAAYYTLDEARDTGRVVIDHPATHRPITLDFAALRGQDLAEDLHLRDFTINAMAMTLEGEIIDPHGGQKDLAARLIRVTSERSFCDDPARLLRAVRQAGALSFHLETMTEMAIRAQVAKIKTVAAERIQAELCNILASVPASHSLQALADLGLLHHILPEAQTLQSVHQSWPHHYPNVWEHTLAAVSAVEGILAMLSGAPRPESTRTYVPVSDWAWEQLAEILMPLQSPLLEYLDAELSVEMPRRDLLKWGALYHDTGKAETRSVDQRGMTHFYGHAKASAETTQARLQALHFPNKAIDFVAALARHHMRLIDFGQSGGSRRAIYRFYRATGESGVGVVLLALADALAVWGRKLDQKRWNNLLQGAEMLLDDYFHRPEETIAPPPLLDGRDLIAMNIPPGPVIGDLLEMLRESQAAGEIATKAEARRLVRDYLEREG